MSWDFYFWKTSTEDDPAAVVELLAEEEADCLASDDQVLAFRGEVLRRWPELAARIEPWHPDLGDAEPWGRTDLADRFVILTLQWGWADQPALVALANEYGLLCYDPQISKFV